VENHTLLRTIQSHTCKNSRNSTAGSACSAEDRLVTTLCAVFDSAALEANRNRSAMPGAAIPMLPGYSAPQVLT